MNLEPQRIHIIAEMACSHEGDPALGRKIIDGAGNAGADSIQFQVWRREDMMVPQHPDFRKLGRIELSRDEWRGLADHVRAKYPKMEIIACVYERESVDFCETMDVDAYKLHSADLSNPFLVRYVAQAGRRIDLSVGASTLDEIQRALEWIRATSNSEIWIMYGYQNFPTPTDAIHLDFLKTLQNCFGLPVGYQDHSDGDSPAAFWLPAVAAGMGVEILEKHITHDRLFKGIDHEAALNPEEFAKFVEMVREIERARGSSHPRPFSPEEQKYRKYSKKSLVAAREIAEGRTIGEDDLLFMRAEDLGLPPDQAGRLIGRKTRHGIAAYQLITEADVQ